ncbi:signal peptide peptidase-like 3 [Exaiptasia diaphana]|uniref:Signal peptide peptidase-like 3 n=1 Tax=Exaiptasia diaphana TaxID=2652724 RepID=A0A913WVD6_EXADI|nr:signal peptide peptidase-like 3 [Exaiptasia diaphana]KXJ27821.1 Signal peptide peptidase-like 3 [Exaiptasia diaphana]
MEETIEHHWFYMLLDTSRVLTIIISILLIVYGSFRALGLDTACKNDESETEQASNGSLFSGILDGFQTITTAQAIFLPVGASCSLLVMFFFFNTLQFFFALCTAVLATVAFSFLLLPVCQGLLNPCGKNTNNKISLGCCGRFTCAELMSLFFSAMLVMVWIVTGHWVLMDALAMGLCVSMIAYIRLPSLKISTLLLSGLLIYDVFWVFFSAYIFKANVMVKVATQQASNPMAYVANKLKLNSIINSSPQISLPGKLVFPSQEQGRFSMLGLGDIVMPGLLLCFVMRYDKYKKMHAASPETESKITYFHCSLIGYIVGLVTATVASEVYKAAQPALLYLVPFTLLPILLMAYLKGDLRKMWQDPFITNGFKSKFLEV